MLYAVFFVSVTCILTLGLGCYLAFFFVQNPERRSNFNKIEDTNYFKFYYS